jgi:hypothetical protein
MSEEDLRAELERLRAENDQLKNKSVRGLSLKVSERVGCPSMESADFPSLYIRSSGARSSQWLLRSRTSS